MSRRWVINASPVIALGKVELLSLFDRLCQEIVIPQAVADEIQRGTRDDPACRWLREAAARWVCAGPALDPVVSAWDLGAGETAVLAWARSHPGFEAILDDRATRNCATALGLQVRGTVGVILLAKLEGLLRKVAPVLDEPEAAGFRLHPSQVAAALRLANEAPPD